MGFGVGVKSRAVVLAGCVLALVAPAVPVSAVDTHAKTAYLSLLGEVGGESYSGVVPVLAGQPVDVSVSCVTVDEAVPTTCDSLGPVKYVWSHDRAAEGSQSVVSFSSPGMHTVQVTASVSASEQAQASGVGFLSFAVYDPFADDAQLSSQNASTSAGVTSAAGLMLPCRTYAGSTGVREGRAMFCPTPPAEMGRTSPYRIPTNAITGANCLADPVACGLPAGLDTAGQVSSGLVDSNGGVLVRPTVCVDNAVSVTGATNRGTNLVTRRGVEPGCASYADMLSAVVGVNKMSAKLPSPAVPTSASRTNSAPNPVADSNLDGWQATSAALSRATVNAPVAATGVRAKAETNDDSTAPTLDINLGNVVAGRTYTVSLYTQAVGQENDLLSSLRDVTGTAFAQGTWLAPAQGWARMHLTGIPMSSGTAKMSISMPTAANGDEVEFTALMVETSTSPSRFTLTSTPSTCSQGPNPSAQSALGAVLLPGARLCDTDAALLKGEAYQMAAKMLNLADTQFTPTNIKDLGDPQTQAAVSAMLSAGAPLVGDLSCQDGEGVCFNPQHALTRAQLADLLAFAVRGYAGASALQVSVSSAPYSPKLGVPFPVNVTVNVPAYYPARTPILVAPVGQTPGVVTCPSTELRAPASGQLSVACTFTPNSVGQANLTFTAVAQSVGASANASISLSVTNDPPVISSTQADVASALFSNEGEPGTSTELYFYDPEGLRVVAGVRSCDPATDVDSDGKSLCPTSGATFPKTGQPRTLTNDDVPSNFVDTADVELGTVFLGPVRNSTMARVTFEPAEPKLAGKWSFVLQVCDIADDCVHKLFEVERANVNDPPVANPVSVTTGDEPVSFTLSGTDEDGVVTAARITSVDVGGTLQFDNDGDWSTVVANLAYPIDTVFRWVPPNGPSNTWSTTFEVRDDGGVGTPALWSSPASLQLVRVRPVGPPTAALIVSPLEGPAKSTEVTFDASDSASDAGDGIVSYLYDFGDGSGLGPVTQSVVEHRYSRTGQFTVSVTVTDARGKTDTVTRQFTSQPNLVANPTFDFSINGWSPVAGLSTLSRLTPGLRGSEGALEVTTGSGVCAVEETSPAVVGVPGMSTGPYTGSAWVKAPSGSVGKVASMSLVETTPAGVSVSVSKATVVLDGKAQYLQTSHTMSQDTNVLRVRFDVASPDSGKCLTVDDVGLVPPSQP